MKPFVFLQRFLRVFARFLVAGGLVGLFFTSFAAPSFATPPAPDVTSVGVPSNGTYIIGQNLDFIVNWSEAVTVNTVGGTPTLPLTLTIGGTVNATYVSGSGTSALVFQYDVVSGEEDTTGVTVGSSIALNGGTIEDATPTDAVLTLNSVGSTAGVNVDSIPPTVVSFDLIVVTGISPTATNLVYEITFSEPVSQAVLGNFEVETTGPVTAALAGVGTETGSSYVLTVQTTGNSGSVWINLIANTGITDLLGNPLVGGFTSAVYVFPPVVTSVAVPADGAYIAGQDLDFNVNWSEPVTVDTTSGTPYLPVTLTTGGTVDAQYISGSGTSTLTFRYVVTPGNQALSGISLGSSINLNSGSIQDTSSNNAVLTLNNVASTTGVIVDAVAPTVISIDTVQPSTNNLTSDAFTVTFSKLVTGVAISDFTVVTTGTASASVISVSTSDHETYTVTIGSVTGAGTLQLDLNGSGTGIADLATNPIAGGFTSGELYTLPAPTPPPAPVVTLTPQAITLTSTSPAHPIVGATFTLSATGGASGNPVTFTVDGSSTLGACGVVGTTVTFTGLGLCVIDANQAGSATFDVAAPRALSITIPAGHFAFVSNVGALKGSNVTLRVMCQGATSCSSTVAFSAAGPGRTSKTRLVATDSEVRLDADTTGTVVVHLNAYGRTLIAHYVREHRTLLVLTARSGSTTVLERVKL